MDIKMNGFSSNSVIVAGKLNTSTGKCKGETFEIGSRYSRLNTGGMPDTVAVKKIDIIIEEFMTTMVESEGGVMVKLFGKDLSDKQGFDPDIGSYFVKRVVKVAISMGVSPQINNRRFFHPMKNQI